jgi:diguanylate cyclase
LWARFYLNHSTHQSLVRILLVDEALSSHAHFVRLLNADASPGPNQLNWQLNWCAAMSDALKSMTAGSYDVIFLDSSRDPAFSRRLLNAAISQGCTVPVVALYDSTQPQLRDQMLMAGATDYLARGSFDTELLQRVIRYCTNLRSNGDESGRWANYDPLTGLPNRILFLDRFAQALSRAERSQMQLTLFYLDVDDFKKVNDSFGYESGDRLIEMLAERILSCIRSCDSAARISGDEFAILLDQSENASEIATIAQRLADAIAQPFALAGHQVSINCSIGIAVYPQAGRDIDALLKAADLARQKAKAMRGCTYRFYNEKMNVDAMTQLYREADLRRGLRRSEFRLYYQPRISLETGRIVGMEGLIRWLHPVRGLVNPAEFIPLAEDSGLIVPLGYWIVHQACEDICSMAALGLPLLDVALNLSFKQFQDEKFVETVTHIINESGVDPKRLEFELTETTIMTNSDETDQCMRALNALGSSFSLDDFGTGYSSFVHIHRLPIDALKVDRSFVDQVMYNEDAATIVTAIINLAHSLGMMVVAEGAENEAQMRFLKEHHCDQVQGFFFSPPVPFEALCELIRSDARLRLDSA